MDNLSQLATRYQVDQNKEHYPLNTIRILYLILIETLSDQPEQGAQVILDLIPEIRAILDKRISLRLETDQKNPANEIAEIKEQIQKIDQILPANNVVVTIEHLFSYALPIQESLLVGLLSRAQEDQKVFDINDVHATLNLRSMDSLLYSQIVCDIVKKPEQNLAIHSLTNLCYQLNDLVDSIIFAKEDTTDNNFSAFEIIRKSVQDSNAAKALIKTLARELVESIKTIKLPNNTTQLVYEYVDSLASLLGDDVLSQERNSTQVPPTDQAQAQAS